MKKYITWLFANFFYNLNELIASKVCLFVTTNPAFALFRVNLAFPLGIEIPNTRFEVTDPILALEQANPAPIYTARYQLAGIATIDASANDEIELRSVSGFVPNLASGVGGVTAAMNIEKVS
jgi:hypothetical protein